MEPGSCFFFNLHSYFFSNNPLFIFFSREEIPITLSDSFTITIPIDHSEQSTDECGKNKAVCFSGQSLSSLIDPDGCKVNIFKMCYFSILYFNYL